MRRYHPLLPPEPAPWLATDESARIHLVMRYHQRAGIALPNERLHAVVHVIVENQIALDDATPVAATVERLMQEGLDRHEALHAIGSVLLEVLWDRGQANVQSEVGQAYYERVGQLTAERWLQSAEPE